MLNFQPRQIVPADSVKPRGLVRECRRFIRNLPKPCGVFAVNDLMGYEVLAACAAENVSVPNEIAVVAVDNQEIFCENAVPSLSSIALDFYGAGLASAELLNKVNVGRRKPENAVVTGRRDLFGAHPADDCV